MTACRNAFRGVYVKHQLCPVSVLPVVFPMNVGGISSSSVCLDRRTAPLCCNKHLSFVQKTYSTKFGSQQYGNAVRPVYFPSLYSGVVPRMYSSGDPNANTELKGVVVHINNPLKWLKNKWFSYCIRSWIDESFSLDAFLDGAKQALSFFTRLIVTNDYDTLKSIATQEVVNSVKQLVSPWTVEEQQSIEMLVEDIVLATANVTSLSKHSDTYEVMVDVLCFAVKRYKSKPLLIQMTVSSSFRKASIASSRLNSTL
jgi:hypothetical protein